VLLSSPLLEPDELPPVELVDPPELDASPLPDSLVPVVVDVDVSPGPVVACVVIDAVVVAVVVSVVVVATTQAAPP